MKSQVGGMSRNGGWYTKFAILLAVVCVFLLTVPTFKAGAITPPQATKPPAAIAPAVVYLPNVLSSPVEPIDGVGNNLANPNWGSSGTDLLRVSPASYADGISTPSLPNNASARAISNILNNQANPSNPSEDLQTVNQKSLSSFSAAFGQFMDHDMDLTPDGGASFPIAVAPGDPIGPNPLPFTRSQTDPTTGTSTSNPLQQINARTSYLDLSQVYGSTQVVSDALRTLQGGLLKTSPGNMLPYNSLAYFTQDQINALNMANDAQAVTPDKLFATGDRRGNETLELTVLQTLFVRNHNRIAAQLQAANPGWSDQQLFQEARKVNIAEYQIIVYNEWIPAVLGEDALPRYTGYNPNVNASIATEFSTVAFRFGHSLLSNNIERTDNNGQGIADVNPNGSSISLAVDFFDPNLVNPTGVVDPLTGHSSSDIGPVLNGIAGSDAQAMDLLAVEDIRNLLFGNGGLGGQDLIARDVQRARDDGIGTYNQVRVAYHLPAVTKFSQITSNVQVQQELQQAYGTVDSIDPFEGGLAEDHVPGSNVGPLFQAIMANQFQRLRAGDRFFYLNENFSPSEVKIIRQDDTLTKVIESNTTVTNLQSNAFFFTASISGTVYAVAGHRHEIDLLGITVQLMDNSGNPISTTMTDRHGQYSFNQFAGISQTGTYNVVLVLPPGLKQITPNPSAIQISRGGTNVEGVNFGIDSSGP